MSGEIRPLQPYPLTPALSPRGGEGEREPIFVLFKT
ncbi:hypothetical protein PMI19_05383 [Pseudomonas sp. GM16]|nr:hypothetical protein PMI19_05383 [Pseudomonas sp. GM16]